MAKIVAPPKPRHVQCSECQAIIEYLPEDVETDRRGRDGDTVKYVKCPRRRCHGEGIISVY